MRKTLFSLALLTILALVSVGYEQSAYYYQAAVGQLGLMLKRQAIDEITNNPEIDPSLVDRLQLVQQIRLFANNELKLPVAESYGSYVDLHRDFVVWNVFAAPELSMESYLWCFPVVGCVSYRGYFAEQDAVDKSRQLKAEGYDVHVGGIAAYSTLGWFDDSVLNTFVYRDDPALVSVLVHELAHKKLFIKGDTAFNESFATAVANRGLDLWLEMLEQGENRKDAEFELSLQKYRQSKIEREQIISLVMDFRNRLSAMYRNDKLTVEQKRTEKKAMLDLLYATYLEQKAELDWSDDFDSWIATMNNARFTTVANYQQWVPAFEQLMKNNHYDMPAFYLEVADLSRQSKEARDDLLQALLMQFTLSKNNNR